MTKYQQTRHELLSYEVDRTATFRDLYNQTHIAYSDRVKEGVIVFLAFDSNLLHILVVEKGEEKSHEETFANIASLGNLFSKLVFLASVHPKEEEGFVFVKRPCLENYIQNATFVSLNALTLLGQKEVIYTNNDFKFLHEVTKGL
jgi:hypothetical protein